jgi:hypothetical protein
MRPSAAIGKASWLENLDPECTPKGANEAFIRLLGQAWKATREGFTPEHHEDDISRELAYWVDQEQQKRNGQWNVFSQPESLGRKSNKKVGIIGRCDIVLSVGCKKIVYECKRLNISDKKKKIHPKSREYIKDGLHRFTLDMKYPTANGICGMVGYVMNGDLKAAHKAICAHLEKLCTPELVVDPELPLPCEASYRFRTEHALDGKPLLAVHHLLFPVSNVT